jgi:hypothetical protein
VEVDLSKTDKDKVGFGAWVRYNGRVVRIVGVDEANVDQGLVSFISPIAKALTGKKAGDVIEMKGAEKIVVEAISYEPMELTQIVRENSSGTTKATERRSHRPVIEQIEQTLQETQNEDMDPLVETDKPRRFEPEMNPMEFLPIVNERGNIVGRALYLELHQGNKMLHPVIHLHVLNGQGKTTGLYWWHVAFGDTPEKTLKRKLAETPGLSGVKPTLKRQYLREAKNEKELVFVFTVVSDEKLLESPEDKAYLDLFAKD